LLLCYSDMWIFGMLSVDFLVLDIEFDPWKFQDFENF
jgi:hypothetical protein